MTLVDVPGYRPYFRTLWTPEREDKLKDLAAQNIDPSEIGKELGISRGAVNMKLLRLAVPKREQHRWISDEDESLRRLASNGLSGAQIAREIGKTRNAVIGRCKRLKIKLSGAYGSGLGRKWLVQEDEFLLDAINGGVAVPDIGKKLGRSTQSIYHRIRSLGIKLGRERRRSRSLNVFHPRKKSSLRVAIDALEKTDLQPDESPFACTLMKLTEVSCRWPLGDPKSQDFQFCGAQKVEGLSYCPRHAVLAYRRS